MNQNIPERGEYASATILERRIAFDSNSFILGAFVFLMGFIIPFAGLIGIIICATCSFTRKRVVQITYHDGTTRNVDVNARTATRLLLG